MLPKIVLLGQSINMYNFWFYFALLSVVIVLMALRKTFEYTLGKSAFYCAFTLGFGLLSAYLTGVLKRVMLTYANGAPYEDTEILRNYGIPMFLPVFLLIYCLIFKDDFKKLSDYIAPSVYSVMTFVKVACVFNGCCYGKESEFGIWNEELGTKTFPVQLFDSITSLLIFIICIVLIKKWKGKHSGYIYPIGGILFALTKGFWEFFRVHPFEFEQHYLGTRFTLWQYWLLVLFIGCVIWLFFLLRNEKKERALESCD